MAQQKTSSSDVKSFCSRMIADHTKMASQATALAKAELQETSSSEFDEDFMRDQVQDHRNDISAARAAEDSVQNPDVKSLAQ